MTSKKKHSILIVDDDKANVGMLCKIFNSTYNVLVANNGHNAILSAKENAPDLILLDIIMPDISGFAVFEELRELEETRATPIIFVTGLSRIEDEERAFALGAVDYITKPYNRTIVEERVLTHMRMLEQLQTIERLSKIDDLTNLHNRRSFNEQFSREWSRSAREKSAISLLMIDIDRFKNYNDTYGHIQGDVALQALSEILTHSLKRPADLAARWGGEEFVLLLPDTDLVGATMLAEQIRAEVERRIIPTKDGTPSSITISIGVHTERADPGISFEKLLSGADTALYAAKDAGRNRVCIYEKD